MTSGNSRDSAAPGEKRENRSKTSPGGVSRQDPPSGGAGGTASPLRSPPLTAFQYHVCRPGKDEERRYKYKLSDGGKGGGLCPVEIPQSQSNTSRGVGVWAAQGTCRIRQIPRVGRGVGSECGVSRAGRGELVTVTETWPCALRPQASPCPASVSPPAAVGLPTRP